MKNKKKVQGPHLEHTQVGNQGRNLVLILDLLQDHPQKLVHLVVDLKVNHAANLEANHVVNLGVNREVDHEANHQAGPVLVLQNRQLHLSPDPAPDLRTLRFQDQDRVQHLNQNLSRDHARQVLVEVKQVEVPVVALLGKLVTVVLIVNKHLDAI